MYLSGRPAPAIIVDVDKGVPATTRAEIAKGAAKEAAKHAGSNQMIR
jgi:hypothetical protein